MSDGQKYGGRHITIILSGMDHQDGTGEAERLFDAISDLASDMCPEGADLMVSGGPINQDWEAV